MIFESGNFNELFAKQLSDAMSFVFEADAEVAVVETHSIRKVLHTETIGFSGEYAAGDLYGKFRGTYSSKDGKANVERVFITMGEVTAESTLQFTGESSLFRSLTNAHRLYFTRKDLAPKQYDIIKDACERLRKKASKLDHDIAGGILSEVDLIMSQVHIDFDINNAVEKDPALKPATKE